MTPTPRPSSWETCSVEGDSVDEAWCTTHDRHPGECWDSRESEIKRLTVELAEAKRCPKEGEPCKSCRACFEAVSGNLQWMQQERDAALAEVERWKDDYDEEARACEENARETQEARASAEALRTGVNKAMDLLEDSPDGPQLDLAYDVLNQALGAARRANRDARPHQWAEGGFCNTHMTYGCGKARLSPPAPAPTTIHDVLQARLERLRDKPAPETGKCTCPPNSLDVLCPLPIKDHGAPAPCEHSWVEEEDEANLPQTACENCGATKPAPGGRER